MKEKDEEDFFELERESPAEQTTKRGSSWDWLSIMQKRKKNQDFIWWKSIWVRQAAYAVGGGLILVFLTHLLLLQITRHGKDFLVPDFTGMSIEAATQIAKKHHLRLDITDSVYVHQLPRGAVFKQNPMAATSVKKNRRILLTINSITPREVFVPNVVGFSLRQAKAVLNAQGLDVGTLTYTPDIASNNVLEQRYKGSFIGSSVKLPAESAIDLILGVNEQEARTSIPSLAGLTFDQARDLITEYSLNMGRVQFDKEVKNYADSSAAKVYRQIPAAAPQSELWNLGARVDIYLTTDPNKLLKE